MYRKISTDLKTQMNLYDVVEIQLSSEKNCQSTNLDQHFPVSIVHADGTHLEGCGFIDRGSSPSFRFSPQKKGIWHWRVLENDYGINNQEGELIVTSARIGNRFLEHGAIEISKDQRYFTHQDGTPFFWLGESAWCTVQQSDEAGWEIYLSNRSALGFSAVQFNSLLNWEGTIPFQREPFPIVNGKPDLNQYSIDFFQYLD